MVDSACQCSTHGFNSWVENIPWRRKWPPTPVFLPGKIPWTGELGRPWGHKESDMAEHTGTVQLYISFFMLRILISYHLLFHSKQKYVFSF